MDAQAGFLDRLRLALPLLAVCFVVGFVVAAIAPRPRLLLTIALALTTGMLVLGPYAAAAAYGLRLQRVLGGRLRWPVCLLLSGTAALLLGLVVSWSRAELALAAAAALAGTVLGHDATLAVLGLRGSTRLDRGMVVLLPVLVGLAVVAGYSSFGFGSGMALLIASLLRRS